MNPVHPAPTIEKSGLANRAGTELSSNEADRRSLEHVIESESAILEDVSEAAGSVPVTAAPIPTAQQVKALEKDQVTVEVENILEKDLKDIYSSLPDNLRPVFKTKGEETAQAISEMIKKASLRLGEVMDLILAWLKIIPGVNKFFLEQEAKIKTDRIFALSQEIAKEQNVH